MTEKKSERLEVRLGYQEKSEFVEACETQGDTPSSALRRFIRGYVRRADADFRGSYLRALTRGWRWPALAMSGLATTLVIAGLMFLPKMNGVDSNQDVVDAMRAYGPLIDANAVSPVNNDTKDLGPILQQDLFSKYDQDTDGVLKLREILPNDVEMHRVLDLNGDGITIDEFFAVGRMDYKLADAYTMKTENGFPAITVKTKEISFNGRVIKSDLAPIRRMVEFDLSGPVPIINSFLIDPTAVKLSTGRSVFWVRGDERSYAVFSDHDYRVRNMPVGKP